jgi:hypothetical protein
MFSGFRGGARVGSTLAHDGLGDLVSRAVGPRNPVICDVNMLMPPAEVPRVAMRARHAKMSCFVLLHNLSNDTTVGELDTVRLILN